MTTKRYTAFVSYSHKDDKWTKWLLDALEKYRIPRHLVGTEGTNGTVPERLNHIFRDRELLAAGSCLDAKVREALEQSQTLIVVCSPNAVHSFGVNHEIEQFRKMRGDDHIFYIIKEGEPHAAARGLDPDLECFPKALLDHSKDATTTYGVPLAADARDQGDGKKMAFLKVVAGILGVNLDSLVRRDLQSRQRRLWGSIIAATAGMMLTTSLATQAYLASREAEEALARARRQQDEAESLIQFLADGINHTLWRIGETDLMEQVTERLIEHYEGQNSPSMGPQEIARKIRSMRSLQRTRLQRGQHGKVLLLMEETVKTTRSLVHAAPDDLTLLNSHAQALQILSSSYWRTGECDKAMDVVEERVDISAQLSRRNDIAFYMRARLGNALVDRGFFKLNCMLQPDSAMADFNAALEIRQDMAKQKEEWIGALAGAYRFLGWGYEIVGPLQSSIEAHRQSQEHYTRYMEILPDEVLVEFNLYRFALEMADTLINAGQTDEARRKIAFAQEGLKALTARHPDNPRWAIYLTLSHYLRGTVLYMDGDHESALKIFNHSIQDFEGLITQLDKGVENLHWLLSAKTYIAAGNLALGNPQAAEQHLNDVTRALKSTPDGFFNTITGRKAIAFYHNTTADLLKVKGEYDLAHEANRAVIAAYGPIWTNVHPAVRFELMKAYMAVGRIGDASEIAGNLHGIGFLRADFQEAGKALASMKSGTVTLSGGAPHGTPQPETR